MTTSKFLGAGQRYGGSRAETAIGQSKSLHNAVVVSDNPVWLVEMGYKTAAKYGPYVVQFNQEFDFLTHHLREYRTRSRPRLLCRESSHDHFMNKKGCLFDHQAHIDHF